MKRADFEREFHSRTLAYLPAYADDQRPVVVRIEDTADNEAAHVLALGLVNQLARAHSHLVFTGHIETTLKSANAFGGDTVGDAMTTLARAINPYINLATHAPADTQTTIAIGAGSTKCDLRVGCDGWCATFGNDTAVFERRTSILGAMLASCLAAGFALHRLLGPTSSPVGSYSLWNYGAAGAEQGPELPAKLDVGRVLQAGAGGVGAALNFWSVFIGLGGLWTICDGDDVDVSNLNRQLAFTAAHAGFADTPVNKARRVAALLGPSAIADPHWYGDTAAVTDAAYDVVLVLANERGVRAALQHRQPPLLLHATTSSNWEAQVHRHIAGRDDCVPCRTGREAPKLACSTTTVDDHDNDAALPFLSGAAGVLLLASLLRVQLDALDEGEANHWLLNLAEGEPDARVYLRRCETGCTSWGSEAVRRAGGARTRYAHLDRRATA